MRNLWTLQASFGRGLAHARDRGGRLLRCALRLQSLAGASELGDFSLKKALSAAFRARTLQPRGRCWSDAACMHHADLSGHYGFVPGGLRQALSWSAHGEPRGHLHACSASIRGSESFCSLHVFRCLATTCFVGPSLDRARRAQHWSSWEPLGTLT